MLHSTAVFATTTEDIPNSCHPVSSQKHNCLVRAVRMKGFFTVKLRRGAFQQKEGVQLERTQLNDVKICGTFKS